MKQNRNLETIKKCDACQADIPKQEIKYMSLKTCCSVQRIPLCRECYEKYAKWIKPKEDKNERD
jgi:hypothetical protein